MNSIDYSRIPEPTMQSLRAYASGDRIPPGSFLYAVLTNNLKGAFGAADEKNIAAMFEIVSYMYNKLPSISQGSPERVRDWLNKEELKEFSDEPKAVRTPTSSEWPTT